MEWERWKKRDNAEREWLVRYAAYLNRSGEGNENLKKKKKKKMMMMMMTMKEEVVVVEDVKRIEVNTDSYSVCFVEK